jgi:hypothetical protein
VYAEPHAGESDPVEPKEKSMATITLNHQCETCSGHMVILIDVEADSAYAITYPDDRTAATWAVQDARVFRTTDGDLMVECLAFNLIREERCEGELIEVTSTWLAEGSTAPSDHEQWLTPIEEDDQ